MQETDAESSEASFTQIVNGAVFVSGILDLFTARKRSLGKVMFLHLSVILFTWGSVSGGGEFCSEGCLCPGRFLSRGSSVRGGGLCQGDTPYSKERAVRILLKCILV